MKRYSVFAVAREALRYHQGWGRAWRSPEPKKKYEAIIIGAGGHGLATEFSVEKLLSSRSEAFPRLPPGKSGDEANHNIETIRAGQSSCRSQPLRKQEN